MNNHSACSKSAGLLAAVAQNLHEEQAGTPDTQVTKRIVQPSSRDVQRPPGSTELREQLPVRTSPIPLRAAGAAHPHVHDTWGGAGREGGTVFSRLTPALWGPIDPRMLVIYLFASLVAFICASLQWGGLAALAAACPALAVAWLIANDDRPELAPYESGYPPPLLPMDGYAVAAGQTRLGRTRSTDARERSGGSDAESGKRDARWVP